MSCYLSLLSSKIMSSYFDKINIIVSIRSPLKMCCSVGVIVHPALSKLAALLPNFLLGLRDIWLGRAISMEDTFVSPVRESMIVLTFWALVLLSIIDRSGYCLTACRGFSSCLIKNSCCNFKIIVLHFLE